MAKSAIPANTREPNPGAREGASYFSARLHLKQAASRARLILRMLFSEAVLARPVFLFALPLAH